MRQESNSLHTGQVHLIILVDYQRIVDIFPHSGECFYNAKYNRYNAQSQIVLHSF